MSFKWGEFSDKGYLSIIQSTARVNIWEGSVRSSKTVSSIVRWFDYVKNTPEGGLLFMTGKTLSTLERNIIRPIIDMAGPSRAVHNRGTNQLHLFGKTIDLVGANDEKAQDKIRGSTVAGVYGDEIALWPESFFNMLLSRMSVKGAKLFGTTNPDSPYHWLKQNYIDRRHELDLRVFHFTLDDNPTLDPDYVEALKKEYTGLWYKRFIEGLWVLAEGVIYDMWDEDTHVVNVAQVLEKLEQDKFKRYFAAVDYGTVNPCTFGLYGHNGTLPAYLTREYYYDGGKIGRQKTDGQYADDFADFCADIKPYKVIVDPSAQSFITELKGRGYNVIEANNDVLDGIRFVGSLLNRNQFFVDRSCKHTIQESAAYVWDEKAQKKGEDKPVKQHDHAMDRNRYGLFTEFFRKHPGRLVGLNFD